MQLETGGNSPPWKKYNENDKRIKTLKNEGSSTPVEFVSGIGHLIGL